MTEQLRELLQKLPLIPILMCYGLYLGYDYYSFMNDPASPLIQKQQAIVAINKETTATLEKVKKANEFFRTLEQRRSELRALAVQLEEAKGSLSEQTDVSSFVRLVVAEANKVGMSVQAIRPTESHEKEYYVEQSFDLKFKGVFVQLVVFLERLANLERIVRVNQFTLRPVTLASSQYVQLEGTIQLNTYRYRGSRADELLKAANSASGSTTTAQTAPAATSSAAAPTTATAATPPGGGK